MLGNFCNLFRFIDNLNLINGGGGISKLLNEIYPEELQLNKENPDNSEDSLLDFKINIEKGKLIVAN